MTRATDPTDTKAAWRRRALRAEERVASLERLLSTHHSATVSVMSESAAAKVAIDEIRAALRWYDSAGAQA